MVVKDVVFWDFELVDGCLFGIMYVLANGGYYWYGFLYRDVERIEHGPLYEHLDLDDCEYRLS